MPTATHGITAQTPDHLVLDAGAVYLNYGEATQRLLGATRGGSEFNLNRTLREMPVDGARGPVKGMVRVERVEAQLTVNLLEMTVANIRVAIAGAEATPDGAHDVITGAAITDEAYLENVAVVATVSGSDEPVIIQIENALAQAPFNLALADMDEAVPSLVFLAHFDPANMDEEPWSIRYPNAIGS